MYTEVFQSAAFELMTQEKISGASTTALALTPPQMADLIDEIDYYAPRIVLRPQEISNNPAVVRQMGVIALNTALEFDLYGHVNSTHVMGRMMVNGIGGSGDFARNAYLSIFMCPSTAKDGTISTVVPMCPHVDHNEHSVNVVVTEQGLADLRGLAPEDRAERIIDECAHPRYREYLHHYIRRGEPGTHPPRPGPLLRIASEPAALRQHAARFDRAIVRGLAEGQTRVAGLAGR